MDRRFFRACICGGGSLGIVCAGVFLSQGIRVNMLTGHPEEWSRSIEVKDLEGRRYSGDLDIITNDPGVALKTVDMVLLCIPGYLIEKTLKDIKPYLKESTLVGSIVSSTGFFFIAHEILGKEQGIFGFQRVPFISRFRKYGHTGDLLGYKQQLSVAIEGIQEPEIIRELLEELFMTPVKLLNNFYEASLTNSNPILHTGRLYSMWKDYKGETYDKPILFYSDWTDGASECLIRMDEEFQRLLLALNISSDTIPALLDYYESTDAHSLTEKIKSIPAFKNIQSPMKRTEKGWVPDFKSRYFTEDFPFGLKFIRDLAIKSGIPISVISEVYEWGMGKLRYGDYQSELH